MYIYKKLLGVTGAVLLSTSMNLCAAEDVTAAVTQSGQKTESEAGISPIELVKKSYAFLGSLKHYSFKATIVNEDEYADHMMLYLTHNYSVAVQRPDKVRMQVRGDVDNRDTVMNNGTVSIYEIEANKYAQIAIDGDIDDALDTLGEEYGYAVPLTQLLYSDTAEDLDFSSEAKERLTCSYDGEDIEIGFNSRFMQEMLSTLEVDNVVVEMSAPNRAGILVPEESDKNEDILMLIMPVMLTQ